MPATAAEPTPPKLFISYSWTSEDHKQWVLDLATGLRENGVDVILDRWHLLNGQDTHVFMEQMVNDPEIEHVALICDRKYVEKANLRDGGVGVEAQIITPNVYANHQQTKFVAVVTELDENGKAYVPTYYGANKWLPFLDATSYPDDFDMLLRWVFNKPSDKPPPVGKRPAFLTEDERTIKFATTSLQRRAVDAMKNGKPNALAALTEYLERVIEEFEKLRVRYNQGDEKPWDDLLIRSIEEFLPYRNELVSTFVTIAMYVNEEESWKILHDFFEKLIPFLDPPHGMNSYNRNEFDNYAFIIWELFLYLIATNLKYQRFDAVAYFLDARYFLGNSTHQSQERMKSFPVLWAGLEALENRKHRLGLRIWNLQSELLNKRNGGRPVNFAYVITADFILHIRCRMEGGLDWFPLRG